jgi:hypothetical protein
MHPDQPIPMQQEAPNWFRGFLQGKTRIAMAWIFAGLLVLLARDYPTAPGLVISFLGATVRMWASGFLRKDARPAVGGPYRFVRNPLYLGTYLMAVGTLAAIEQWWVLGVLSVLYAVVYHFIILDEETKLIKIFGEPYAIYCKTVPRFFPMVFPQLSSQTSQNLAQVNPDRSHRDYDWALARKNKWWEPHLTFIALTAGITGIAWVWQSFT